MEPDQSPLVWRPTAGDLVLWMGSVHKTRNAKGAPDSTRKWFRSALRAERKVANETMACNE